MRASTVLALLLCGLSGCFPPPHLKDAQVDTTSDAADSDTASAEVAPPSDTATPTDADTSGPCTSDDACHALDTPCTKGVCGTGGTCVTQPVVDTACDDGNACTRDDRCSEGACKGEAYACDDSRTCTRDLCDGVGGCSHPVDEGHCLIADTCVDAGTPNPDNPCERCSGGHDWTKTSDLPCDDADTCTIEDRCVDGTCVGGGTPDDKSAGDWLVIPAVPAQPTHAAFFDDLLAARPGGVVASGRVIGQVSFPGVGSYTAAGNTRMLAGLSPTGSVSWAVAIEGGWEASLVGEWLDGSIAVVTRCDACSLKARWVGTESSTEIATTTADTPSLLLAIDEGEVRLVGRYSHAPSAIDDLDRVYCLVDVPGVATAVRRDDDSPELIGPEATAEHDLAVVRFAGDSGMVRLGTIRIAPPAAGGGLPHLWSAGRIHVAADGTVYVPFGGSAGTIELTGRGPALSFVSEQNFVATAIIEADGTVRAVRPVITGIEHPVVLEDLATLSALTVPNAVIVYGTFEGREVTFGDGANARPYTSHQSWSKTGPLIGASGEGFVGVLDPLSSSLRWFATLAPTIPSASGGLGSGVRGAVASPDGFFLLGTFDALGVIQVAGSEASPVPAPANGEKGSSVLAEFNLDGSVRWARTMERAWALGGQGSHPAYVTGTVYPGTNGIGPTAIEDLTLDPKPARGFIQRFDSAGGLSCGAADPRTRP